MKLEITQPKAAYNGKALIIGQIIDVKSDTIPPSLIGKAREAIVVSDKPAKPERVMVVNPATPESE